MGGGGEEVEDLKQLDDGTQDASHELISAGMCSSEMHS